MIGDAGDVDDNRCNRRAHAHGSAGLPGPLLSQQPALALGRDRDGLHLYLDPSRVVQIDYAKRQALISCGAALDHLRVAMAAAGWKANIDRFPHPNNPDHLASISFTETEVVTDIQRRRAQAIALRRTDRLPFGPVTDWADFETHIAPPDR